MKPMKKCLVCRAVNVRESYEKHKNSTDASMFKSLVSRLAEALKMNPSYFEKQGCHHSTDEQRSIGEARILVSQASCLESRGLIMRTGKMSTMIKVPASI